MKQRFLLYIVVIMLICTVSFGVSASIFDWKVYESEYFVVFYQEGYKYQAEEVLYYLEKYRQETMELVENQDDFKTLVIVQDAGLESNGAAVAVNHKINILTNNPSTLSRMEGSEGYKSWFKQVAIHELTHLAQISNASGFIGKLASLGGGIYSPNLYTPTWMKEGIAVYNESKSSQYEGRLNNGYYDSFMAARVKSDQIPDLIELSYEGNEYIFGAKFINYLANSYGEEKLTEYFKGYSSNIWGYLGAYIPALGIDSSANKVFGKSFPELYEEWKEYEKEQFKNWDMNAQEIVNNDEGKILKLTKYKNKLYYIKERVYNPAPFIKIVKPVIMEYDIKNGKEIEIDELEMDSNGSLQVIDNKIYYSTKVSGVGILFSYNIETGETQGHSIGIFKDFVVLRNGDIIYVRDAYEGFGSEIWKFDADDKNDDAFKKIGKVDQLISEIIAYQNNYIVVSKERFGSWNINYLEKDWDSEDNFSLKKIINSPYLEKSIKVNGDILYYTANYNNSYAMYQYNLTEKELTKVTSVSYASDGIVENEKIYFVGVTAKGEAIYQTELGIEKYPLPQEEKLEKVDINIVSKDSKNAFIKNLSYLFKPYIRFPYMQGEDALGLLTYRVDYLNNFETTFMLETYGSGYSSYSFTNYISDSDDELKSNLQFHYDNGSCMASLIFGDDIIFSEFSLYKTREFKNSSLTFIGTAIYAPKINGIEFVPGESYLSSLLGVKGRLGYTHKLFEIHKGSWNPNIYLGDIYGDISIETYNIASSTVNYDPYYPYSNGTDSGNTIILNYQVLLEALIGFNQKLVPSAGVRYYSHLNTDELSEKSKLAYFFNLSAGF